MRKINYLKLLLTSLALTSCFLVPKNQEEKEFNVKYYKDFANIEKIFFNKFTKKSKIGLNVGIIKTEPLQTLKDINDKPVLNGLVYSFLLSPTFIFNEGKEEKDAFVNFGLGKVLVLEVKKEIDEKIKVEDFYFVNKDGSSIGLSFNTPNDFAVPHFEDSQETEYKTAYSRGIGNFPIPDQNNIKGEELLGKIINAYYDYGTKTWRYMYLKIILEKEVDRKKEYIVKINPYIFNELVKEFRKTHTQDLAKGKNTLPYLPVNDN